MCRVVFFRVQFWDQNNLPCILMTYVKSHKCLNFKYVIFADDTNLLCCDRDLNELVRMINGVLAQLQTWFSVNLLMYQKLIT